MPITREQVLRLSVSLLIVPFLILIAAIIAYTYGSPAGYHYYQAPTLYEISNINIAENSIMATIHNKELNTVSLDIWFEIVDEVSNNRIYRSEQEKLDPLPPQQSTDIRLRIPDDYLPLSEGQSIELKVSEFIAYVDGRPDIFEQLRFSAPAEDAPVRLNHADVDVLDKGTYLLTPDITIDNDANIQQDYRYSFTIHPITDSTNRILLEDSVFGSQFFFATLDAQESASFSPEIELAIAGGEYRLSLWVQKLANDNTYVHFWQTTLPDSIEIADE